MSITPAALAALLNGDNENFIAASTPGGIEAQEKRGQQQQAQRQTLPKDMGDYRKDLEASGFEFGKECDGIFIEAKFPKGWSKRPTDHSMWTELLDAKGRKRGAIFYKAAFYDRSAHMHLSSRFTVQDDYAKPIRTVAVKDECGMVEKQITGLENPDWNGDRNTARALNDKIEAARKELGKWLDQNYPDWKSATAYWD